jgi:hypothetical protein
VWSARLSVVVAPCRLELRSAVVAAELELVAVRIASDDIDLD